MDEKQIQQKLIQAVASDYVNETGDKNPDEKKLKEYIKQKGGEKYLQKKLQSLTQKAAHGTKLDYFRKLKNQCPEGEELYYYKKGGSIGCGCKKKEEGGEIIEAKKGTTVEKFKAEKMQNPSRPIRTQAQQKEINKKSQEDYERGYGDHNMNPNIPQNSTQKPEKKLDPKTTRVLPGGKYPSNWTSQDRQIWERLHGDNDEGAAVSPPKRKEKGGRVEKDCGGSAVAKFKAKCGAKMKKHRQGGSLNLIPFMQEGTNKGGIRQSLSELIPLYGTYQIGKRFINNPSWSGAGELALSAVGDAAMLTGVGAGAGLALKAGNAAVKAGKIAKTANALRKVKAARNLKYGQPYAISGYYDDAAKTASNLAMDAAAYGGDYGKAVQQGSKLMRQASWADEAANTYNSAKWAAGNGAGIEAMTAFGRRQ